MFKFLRKLFYRKERRDALVRYNNGERIPTDLYRLYYDDWSGRYYLADPAEIRRAQERIKHEQHIKEMYKTGRRKP